jgi:hypothetical protein
MSKSLKGDKTVFGVEELEARFEMQAARGTGGTTGPGCQCSRPIRT